MANTRFQHRFAPAARRRSLVIVNFWAVVTIRGAVFSLLVAVMTKLLGLAQVQSAAAGACGVFFAVGILLVLASDLISRNSFAE